MISVISTPMGFSSSSRITRSKENPRFSANFEISRTLCLCPQHYVHYTYAFVCGLANVFRVGDDTLEGLPPFSFRVQTSNYGDLIIFLFVFFRAQHAVDVAVLLVARLPLSIDRRLLLAERAVVSVHAGPRYLRSGSLFSSFFLLSVLSLFSLAQAVFRLRFDSCVRPS
ncbi:hypothetical protein F5X98DRAFT_341138 [Xylaria grammica]|nr:hypothetical protein F5X98DRAFT_341138 [Xylaria grammica]